MAATSSKSKLVDFDSPDPFLGISNSNSKQIITIIVLSKKYKIFFILYRNSDKDFINYTH